MAKKGQSIMEYAIVFVIAALLMRTLMALWSWSVGNIPARQGAFEGSRVGAGSKGSPGVPEVPYG